MAKLKFAAAEVREIVDHMISATDWDVSYFERGKTKPHPQLVFVHDDGLYLLSNGKPAQMSSAEKRFVSYAIGYDPGKDKDVWDRARDAVGGDDFSEYLTLRPDQIVAIQSEDFLGLEINVTKSRLVITVNSKRRAATDAEIIASLRKTMRTRILFVGKDGGLKQSGIIGPQQLRVALDAKLGIYGEKVLNRMSDADLLATYKAHKP